MVERNAGVPDDQLIEFRIGINIGNIIIGGDDIFGEGVNVAARLRFCRTPNAVRVMGYRTPVSARGSTTSSEPGR